MRTFVIGDIHGRAKALIDVLHISGFCYNTDELIVLGDVVDGGRNTYLVIDELLKIKNVILIIGNHDRWALNWMKTGQELPIWVHQGGINTIYSYRYKSGLKHIPQTHIDFLEAGLPYYIDNRGYLYVHGGFNPYFGIETQDIEILTWDRDIIEYALTGGTIPYSHVFIGHTTTQLVNGDTKPLTINNLTLMDTGGGWNGKLSIMNVDTGEYWQSAIQKPNVK
jgi:serine/threonine protein phosphatase 1